MHRIVPICVSILFAFPSSALGQQDEVKAEWVVPYALVGGLIGLGLFGICRPSRRSKKVEKAED